MIARKWKIRIVFFPFGCLIVLLALEFELSKFAPIFYHKNNPIGVFHELDEYIGWKGIPGKERKWIEGRVVSNEKINSHGFRDKERAYQKGRDTFRIVVLGNSFTEGSQVPLEKTFPYILEEKLNSEGSSGPPTSLPLDYHPKSQRFEILNLGITGFSTAQEYLTLKHYGLKYTPDFVILAFYIGYDIEANSLPLHQRYVNAPFFVLNNGKLEEIPFKIKVSKPIYTFMAKFFPNIYYSLSRTKGKVFEIKNILLKLFPNAYNSLDYMIRQRPWLWKLLWRLGIMQSQPGLLGKSKNEIPDYFQLYAQQYPPEWQDAWDVTKSLILQLAKQLDMDKIGFLVVVIPDVIEFQSDMRDKILENPRMRTLIDLKKPEGILSNFLEANKIDYLLLRPDFEKYTKDSGKRLIFPPEYGYHFNADGHALTAQLIYKKLKSDGLLPQTDEKYIFKTSISVSSIAIRPKSNLSLENLLPYDKSSDDIFKQITVFGENGESQETNEEQPLRISFKETKKFSSKHRIQKGSRWKISKAKLEQQRDHPQITTVISPIAIMKEESLKAVLKRAYLYYEY
jgi:hypothetical protein